MSDMSRVSSGPLAARAGWAGGRATCELIRDRLGASFTLPQARRSSFAVGMCTALAPYLKAVSAQHQKRLSCTVPSSAASGNAQLAPLRRP